MLCKRNRTSCLWHEKINKNTISEKMQSLPIIVGSFLRKLTGLKLNLKIIKCCSAINKCCFYKFKFKFK